MVSVSTFVDANMETRERTQEGAQLYYPSDLIVQADALIAVDLFWMVELFDAPLGHDRDAVSMIPILAIPSFERQLLKLLSVVPGWEI